MMRGARVPGVLVRLPHGDQMLHVLFGALALVIFVTEPLATLDIIPQRLQAILMTLVVAMGFLGLRKPTRLARPLIVFSALVVISRGLALMRPHTAFVVIAVLVSVVCLLMLGAALLREVFASGSITMARIEGAIAIYLLMALCFAGLYAVIELLDPAAFTGDVPHGSDAFRSHFLYFSLIAQTSTGFGDITPVHPIARSLVTLQTVAGQVFTTVLLARLVSLELADRERRK